MLLFVLLAGRASAQDTIWVSPDGSGAAFSKDTPGSLTSAGLKAKIIERHSGGVRHVRVAIAEGVYSLTAPIIVDNEMAGSATDTLSFIGLATDPCASGGKATISGGKTVSGWQPAPEIGEGIYKAQLPAEATFRELYVNDKMVIRARHPNRENETDYGPYWRVKNFGTSGAQMVIDSAQVREWSNMEKVEMVIHQDWAQSHVMVNSVEKRGRNAYVNINRGLPGDGWGTANLAYYWENSPDFLDAEGEWYCNAQSRWLYYKPRAGEIMSELRIVYPTAERLLTIAGTADAPVRNVFVQNFEFAHSSWSMPSIAGIICDQGVRPLAWADNWVVPSMIQAGFAHNVHFAHCHIACIGGNGLVFVDGVKNSAIEACHFDQVAGNAIYIDLQDRTTNVIDDALLCDNIRLEHNLIENFGMGYSNGMGLYAGVYTNLAVEHNEIRYSRYIGAEVGGIWDKTTTLLGNTVRYNNIHDIMWLHNDGGGIYTRGNQPGMQITHNWIHDITRGSWGSGASAAAIFLDDYSAHITVENNVLQTSVLTVRQQSDVGPDRNAYENNIGDNSSQSPEIIANAGPQRFPGIMPAVPSGDATLGSITLSEGRLSPPFSASVENYTVNVPGHIDKISLSGSAHHCGAVVSGGAIEKPLKEGDNSVKIKVMAQNGDTKNYTVNITRDSSVVELLQLRLNGTPVSIGDTIRFGACGTEEVRLDAEFSPHSILSVDYSTYTEPRAIRLWADVTSVLLMVRADPGSAYHRYQLFITKSDCTTGIDTNEFLPLRVYPNPVTNELTIDLGNDVTAGDVAKIYNMAGVLVHTASVPGTVNLSHLPEGAYIVKVWDRATKVVKQ